MLSLPDESRQARSNYLVSFPITSTRTGLTIAVSRVKKIIALDSDIHMCSNTAAFVITLATVRIALPLDHINRSNIGQELFIQYLAEQGHRVVKSERKPRRNIQYRDLCMISLSAFPCMHAHTCISKRSCAPRQPGVPG